jgi:hypothetical protein
MSEREMRSAPSPFTLDAPMHASVLLTTAVILVGLILLYIETYNMAPSNLPGYPGDAFYPRAVLGFCIFWTVIILARGLLLPAVRNGADDRGREYQCTGSNFSACSFWSCSMHGCSSRSDSKYPPSC